MGDPDTGADTPSQQSVKSDRQSSNNQKEQSQPSGNTTAFTNRIVVSLLCLAFLVVGAGCADYFEDDQIDEEQLDRVSTNIQHVVDTENVTVNTTASTIVIDGTAQLAAYQAREVDYNDPQTWDNVFPQFNETKVAEVAGEYNVTQFVNQSLVANRTTNMDDQNTESTNTVNSSADSLYFVEGTNVSQEVEDLIATDPSAYSKISYDNQTIYASQDSSRWIVPASDDIVVVGPKELVKATLDL